MCGSRRGMCMLVGILLGVGCQWGRGGEKEGGEEGKGKGPGSKRQKERRTRGKNSTFSSCACSAVAVVGVPCVVDMCCERGGG